LPSPREISDNCAGGFSKDYHASWIWIGRVASGCRGHDLDFCKTQIPVAQEGKKAQDQAAQIAGRDQDGTPAKDTIVMEAQSTGGRVSSLFVVSLVPGGAMERHFGLVKDDTIIEIGTQAGLQKVRDFNDGEMAEALVAEAYQKKLTLVVMRNGQRLTLPLVGGPTVAAPTGTPAAPATPAKPADDSNPLGRQLDAIQGIP